MKNILDYESFMNFKISGIAVIVISVFVILGLLLSSVTVGTGDRGVVEKWGAATGEQFTPGFHFINPVSQSVETFSVRPQTITFAGSQNTGNNQGPGTDVITAPSANGTIVSTEVTVRYRIPEDQVVDFYREWKSIEKLKRDLIIPTVRGSVRDESSTISTTEIYKQSGRIRLSETTTERLRDQLEDEPVILETVTIRDVELPQGYQQSIEQKDAKQQQIESARAEAERKRIEAQGEADANDIKDRSLTRSILIDKFIQSLDETDTVYVPTGDDGLPTYLPVNGTSNGTNTTGTALG